MAQRPLHRTRCTIVVGARAMSTTWSQRAATAGENVSTAARAECQSSQLEAVGLGDRGQQTSAGVSRAQTGGRMTIGETLRRFSSLPLL